MALRLAAPRLNLDLNRLPDRIGAQFKGLDPARPGQWPLLPKVAAWLGVMFVTVAVAWASVLSSEGELLEAEREREPGLKQEYRTKLAQAINLAELRRQKLQVQEFVSQLEKQLPGKAEMEALLSDINQAGIGRGLQFELFKPGQVEVKDYYAELPITIRLTGRFHDIGAFAADIASLPRIVTLHNLAVTPVVSRDGTPLLTMEATARTYRYLDAAEVAEMRRQAQERAKGARK
ncbi:MAG: type 4a pilus biogenesis protein PilO [Rubrivivax sp.]